MHLKYFLLGATLLFLYIKVPGYISPPLSVQGMALLPPSLPQASPTFLHRTCTKAFLSATQPYSTAKTLANDPCAHPRTHKPAALSLLLFLLFLHTHLVPIRSWRQVATSLPSWPSVYLWDCLSVCVKVCVNVSLLSLFLGNFSRAGLLPFVPKALGAS